MLIGLMVALALAGDVPPPANLSPSLTRYECDGSRTVYNDGRSMAQWYSSRLAWRARLSINRGARTWSLDGVRGVDEPFPESNRQTGMSSFGAGSGNSDRGVLEPGRGAEVVLRHPQRDGFPGEPIGRFETARGRLTLPDRGRPGVVASCRRQG